MKYLLILIILGIGALTFLFISNSRKENPSPSAESETITKTAPSQNQVIAEKALFSIHTNSTMRVFTDPRYHNKSENIYITSKFPYLIHVEKAGLKWRDFFSTLPMKLEKDCLTTGTGQIFCSNKNSTLKFYINSIRNDNALDEVINRNDRLLVSFGPENDPNITSQLGILDGY